MRFASPSFILGALALVSSAVASPVEPRVPAQFHLKTVATKATSNHSKGGLYLESYHTGAGLGDAVLNPNKTVASKAFVNGSTIQFDFGQGTAYPWGLQLFGDTNYAAWDPATINVGYGTDGLEIVNGKLVWSTPEFAGWLACDWWHGLPQLFWYYTYYTAEFVPSSCSLVDIVYEAI